MMRRNNLGLLEKNCATKNVIWENVDSTGACFGHTALSKPWQARQVESTLFDNYTNFEEVSPQHNVIIAQFFKDIAMFPPQTLFFESFLISF